MLKYATEDEFMFSQELDRLNINYISQPTPLIIDKGFTKTNGKKYRDMKYTPDFMFILNDITYIIEVKGWSMYDDPVRYRLVEKYLMQESKEVGLNYKFCKIRLSGSTRDGTQQFYYYSSGVKKGKLKSNKKSEIKKKIYKGFFYRENIITNDNDFKCLKRSKKHTYKEVYQLAEVELYKTFINDTTMQPDWFNEWLEDNYVMIGNKKNIELNKYILI